jgi:murein DD-endopeptidase MepM/ murein hydrolase activator NlpD
MGKFAFLIVISGIFYFFSFSLPTNSKHPNNQEFGLNPSSNYSSDDLSMRNNNLEVFYDSVFNINQNFVADGFDFPVGKPDAKNYFNAQTFGKNFHLGEDWNGNGGGNTDLGDPIYSTANGLITFTDDVCCGWGNIVRIVHKTPNHPDFSYVESLYAHMHNVIVKNGDFVRRGQQIGTIGTANGRYKAHLHFEMRNAVNMPIGRGYSENNEGYFAPTEFITQNRPSNN